MKSFFIHATNINGLGASQVVKSLLDGFDRLGYLDNAVLFLPQTGYLSDYSSKSGHIYRYSRKLNNNISRILECIFSRCIFPRKKFNLILGDIPLFGVCNQIVLVHQANLIYPQINPYSSKSIKFRLNRFLFKMSILFVKRIIVQTTAMADQLESSYPALKNKLAVISQPPPQWLLQLNDFRSKKHETKIILFYPSAGYPHKNHEFLRKIQSRINIFSNIEIWVTLSDAEFTKYSDLTFVKNLGYLDTNGMIEAYRKADAMLFLSLIESYGLPLIESLYIGLPIICMDLPYSRCLCKNKAYYIDPLKTETFFDAIVQFKNDRNTNHKMNYDGLFLKEKNWDDVARDFANLIME
jgi:glycosyltransferase involved in cell wall biosynthesis